MTIEQWLGADNEIGARIWHKKYQHKDETFDQWLDRVSGGRPELREPVSYTHLDVYKRQGQLVISVSDGAPELVLLFVS